MKLCLTCAAGGHLDELFSLFDAFKKYDKFVVTVASPRTESLSDMEKTYYIAVGPKPTKYKSLNFMSLLAYYAYILLPCIFILIKERPDVIIGSGGEATLHLSYIGKLLGAKIIYIESLARIDDLSGTGKLVYRISDLFLVQWENLIEKYPKVKYWGKVI